MSNTIYPYEAKLLNGQEVSLDQYRGKVVLVVNTASKCGLTPQYKPLQDLYDQFKDRGFEVLAFPCNQFANQEPGDSDAIALFCESHYGVTFPVFEKVDVNGPNAHPLYKLLTEEAPGILDTKMIKWNFTKFLVGRDGKVLKRYAPTTEPSALTEDIEKLLNA